MNGVTYHMTCGCVLDSTGVITKTITKKDGKRGSAVVCKEHGGRIAKRTRDCAECGETFELHYSRSALLCEKCRPKTGQISAEYVMECGCTLTRGELIKSDFYFCPEHHKRVDFIIYTCQKCGVKFNRYREKNGRIYAAKYCPQCRDQIRYSKGKGKKPPESYRPPKNNDRLRDESRCDCVHYVHECLMQYQHFTSVPCKNCSRYEPEQIKVNPLAVKHDYVSKMAVLYGE